MTTRNITSQRPVVEVKGYDYAISSEEIRLMPMASETQLRRMVEKDMDIPREAIWTRTENKKDHTILFRWTWYEITIKDS